MMPTLTKILFFHAFFHGARLPMSKGIFEVTLSSHLSDGLRRSRPLGQGRLVQPCEHPRAPCWGPDPTGAEHPGTRTALTGACPRLPFRVDAG